MNRRNNGLQKVNIILLCVLLILTSKGILDNVTENTEYHSHELNYRDYVHQNRLLNLFSEEQTSTSSDDEATSGEDSTHRSRGVKCNVTRKQLSKCKVYSMTTQKRLVELPCIINFDGHHVSWLAES